MKKKSKVVPDWGSVPQVELSYRSAVKSAERFVIGSPKDAYNLLINNWNLNTLELQEEFKVILLCNFDVQGIYEVNSGGIDSVFIDRRLVFSAALAAKSTGIILAHNHPSGDLSISEADKTITRQLQLAGDLLQIKVVDHIILSRDKYISFGQKKLL